MGKSAKEMFEKLGYEYEEYENKIMYDYLYCNCGEYREISFDLKNKVVKGSLNIDDDFDFNTQELQAINKQVEELWGKQDGNMEEN